MKNHSNSHLVKLCLRLGVAAILVSCSLISSNRGALSWPGGDMGSSTDGWWEGGGTGGRRVAGSGEWSNRFWLDFEGATVTAAQSFIVQRAGLAQITINPFQPSDLGVGLAGSNRTNLINSIRDGVIARFDGVDAEFFLTQPSSPFHRVHIGSQNFTGQAGVIGVAPLDIGNFRGNDILYVFSEDLDNSTGVTGQSLLISVIVHEIGHASGNQHINNTEAVLNPTLLSTATNLDRSGQRSTGTGTENSLQVLRGTLGDSSAAAAATLAAAPILTTLGIVSDGDIATITVLAPENVEANPGINLRDISYEWNFQGETDTGHTARLSFEGLSGSIPVTITATTPSGQTGTYEFTIDRGN